MLDWIQDFMRCGLLDKLLPPVSGLGDSGFIWIVIGLVLTVWPPTRRCGITVLLALIFCLLVGNITLKPLIARMRPFEAADFTALLIAPPTDFSFPSGHTMSSFAAAGSLRHYYRRWGMAALCLAAVIAFSRLYLYVHYPTDVLAGLMIGLLLSKLAIMLMAPKISA